MDGGDGDRRDGQHNLTTPKRKPARRPSASAPSTPRQYARDFENERTPSPGTATGSHSPRSTTSDPNQSVISTKSTTTTIPSCKYQSTKTARRRMPYDSSDPLPKDVTQSRASLSEAAEKRLDDEVMSLYKSSLPSDHSQRRRDQEATRVREILRKHYPDKVIQVSVFGSSGNLLNTENSDVDICVTMDLTYVCTLAEILAKHGMKSVTCVHAKGVPIVKIWDPQLRVSCDLNVNNHLALANTKLVKAYMEIDERARVLAMAVKHWSRRRILNEGQCLRVSVFRRSFMFANDPSTASGGGLSSYTWTLLVINFLQTRNPPVLPTIELKDANGHVKLDFLKDVEKYRSFGSHNTQSAGVLVFTFFRRLGFEIDYEVSVMSVRQGRLMAKLEKGWDNLVSQRLCCEEPFNTQRNLGNTADEFSFHGIHLEIRRAFSKLLEGQSFDGRVCEQYEFPAHAPKSFFERPLPQPKPTLTRSTSQSGHSNRGGRYGHQRGGRMRSDTRSGNGNRRASSASVFANEMPAYYFPPHFITQPGFYQGSAPVPGASSMERSQQISAEIDMLRMREQQLAMFNQAASRLSALDLERLPVNGTSNGQRRQHDGHRDRMNNTNQASTKYGTMSRSGHYDFPPAMPSYSSPQHGTSTNPPSPMLQQTVPMRRNGSNAQGGDSPNSMHRSQSQPARSYFSQAPYAMFPQGYVQPPNHQPRPGQQPVPIVHKNSIFMPYAYNPAIGAFTYYQLGEDAQPKDPASFSTSDRMQSTAILGQDLKQIPAWEDLQRQGRTHSPSRRSPLLHAMSTDDYTPHPSNQTTSPIPVHLEPSRLTPALSEASQAISSDQARSDASFSSTTELRAPLIVNGSFSSPNPNNMARNGRRMTTVSTTVPESVRASHSGALQSGGLAEKIEAISPQELSSESHRTPPSKPNDSSTERNKSIERTPVASPKARHSLNGTPLQGAWAKKSPSPSLGSSGRGHVPPLDLGAPAERSRELNIAAALSPVREQASPSPINTRKSDAKAPTIANGSSSNGIPINPWKRHSLSSSLDASLSRHKEPPSFSSITKNPTMPNSSTPTVAVVSQSNEWQQVKKGGKKKQAAKTGGQPMPENVSERKGG